MKEHEIRPETYLNRYLELSEQDAMNCFSENGRINLCCIACGLDQSFFQFSKHGFAYTQCSNCKTLFQSPRPPIVEFEDFYRDSSSAKYWAEVFYPSVAEIRREKIFQPRVNALTKICVEKNISVNQLIDVGAGYGIFLEEWEKLHPEVNIVAIEPSESLAKECRKKGFNVVESILENVVGYENFSDLATCFEVIEHIYDPLSFLKKIKKLVRPGGYGFISTLCVDGFDIQTLWEKSSQISPPHHINFFSIEGFYSLFENAGLVDVSITTPGKLDVDIVLNAMQRDPSYSGMERFLNALCSDLERSEKFQEFLVNQRMSSHAWILGRVPL